MKEVYTIIDYLKGASQQNITCWLRVQEVYTIIDYLKGASGFVEWKKYILLLIIWRVQVDLLNLLTIIDYLRVQEVYTIIDYLKGASGFVE